MEEFEIRPGERLPAETRMEIPEVSYEQELLLTPIPFEYRLAALSDYVKHSDEKRTLAHIAKRLNVSQARALQLIEEVGARSEEVHGKIVFEPHTDEVLVEELAWRSFVEELDDTLAISTIAETLNKHVEWVRRIAYGLAVFPEMGLGRNGQPAELYPKSLVLDLRAIALHTPPAGEWYSGGEVAAATGRSDSWTVKMVASLALESGVRIGALSHKEDTHYPQKTLDVLVGIAKEHPHAGDWVTAHRMADILLVSKHWVKRELAKGPFMTEMRLPDMGAATLHYPPEVLETLRTRLEKLVPAGDWLTESGIADAIGKNIEWVQARIDPYVDSGEMRISRAGKPTLHFSPAVAESLHQISLEVKPAGDWMTVYGMAAALGRTSKWVSARITPYLHLAEPRLTKHNNREKPHYPPEVFEAFKRI